jgi:hypothetical protein
LSTPASAQPPANKGNSPRPRLHKNTAHKRTITLCQPSAPSFSRAAAPALPAPQTPRFPRPREKHKKRYFHAIFECKPISINSLQGIFAISKKIANAVFERLQNDQVKYNQQLNQAI